MILGISTSLSQFSVTLYNNGVIYCNQIQRGIEGPSICEFISHALEHVKIDIRDITNIVVDIGPGGTISVRTGVSYANGLSYSLDIPIIGISSAELIGISAYKMYSQPVAVLFKSVKSNYYCGLYNDGNIEFKYSDIRGISKYINEEFASIVLAGNEAAITNLENHLIGVNIERTNIQKVDPYILCEYSPMFISKAKKYPFLPTPINEANLIEWSQDLK
ncbi:MAG: hypothetical protein A2068_09675 [Ignavibacteria bacterium GWB2_35_6b]|nr:MAG: hypothetical protein A2068_09675 [Ignavibacteria bacterium GWB2_35_6b]